MINWPWVKKEEKKKPLPGVVRPADRDIKEIVNGQLDLQNPLPFEWVNWAYEYLGKVDKVGFSDPVLNVHIVYLTYACTKYYEENIC